jgi:hypothetical protein
MIRNPQEKTLRGPRRTWADNVNMILVEIRRDDVDWIDLAQDRDKWRALVNAVMKLRVI